MLEFELDQESVSRAEILSSSLIDDLSMVAESSSPTNMRQELFSEKRYDEQADGVPINDVVANVSKMAIEFAMARRWDDAILFLMLDEGEWAPISITDLFGGPLWPTFGSEDWTEIRERYFQFPFQIHRFWRDIVELSGQEEERAKLTDFYYAVGAVKSSLKDFLSYRFAGMKKWSKWIKGMGNQIFRGSEGPPHGGGTGGGGLPPPPALGPGGGLQVQVSCLTPGLRIHVAPAYFISWVFFGSPTTPVTGYVLPGRYVFAGDGPMLPKRTQDTGVFCIPPSYYPSLTRF